MPLRALVPSLLIALALAGCGRDPRVGDPPQQVSPADKAERVLDGKLAFPPSPTVSWTADTSGFAHDRLFHVPAPGIHPRILFAPEDLPRIRTRLTETVSGKGMMAGIREGLAKGIDLPTTWEGKCFTALAAGDLPGFVTAFQENPADNVPPGSGFKFTGTRTPAVKWGVRNPLLAALEMKAWVALLDEDPAVGRQVAAALATYARFIAPKVAANNQDPYAALYWSATRDLVPQEIVLAYDWAHPWMTPEQRESLRSLIAASIAGKYTLGMDLPAHWRRWNFLGMTSGFPLAVLALEGEAGFDQRQLDRIYEVYRDYLTYSISPLGFGTEGIGYQTVGISHLSEPLIALANRGRNLFAHPHYRQMGEHWLVQTLQPFGGSWQAAGDLGNFPPHLAYLVPHRYFFPGNQQLDYVYRNTPTVRSGAWKAQGLNFTAGLLLCAEDPLTTADGKPLDHRAGAGFGLGHTVVDQTRGVLYTRTGWDAQAFVWHVDCRTDTAFPSHDHPDRGSFTFSALGRAWACDGFRDTESKYHNLVTIDGRGQGYFPPPGRWVAQVATEQATFAAIDAKYCWDWQWTKSMFTESPASLAKRQQEWGNEPGARLLSRIPLDRWEADPSPVATAYYAGFTDGDPRMWGNEDAWILRAPHYPVQKAFRTSGLVRGKHPYALVIDDLQKDDQERLYEWRMVMPTDVEAVSFTGNDLLLGDATTTRVPDPDRIFQGRTDFKPATGDRLLLVRILDQGKPDLPTLQPNPALEAVEFVKTDDSHQFAGRSMGMGKRLVIPARCNDARYKVLLFPHRHGDALPQTTWNAARTELTVTWKDQVDTYRFTTTPAGRTRFDLLRDGNQIVHLP